MSVGLLMSAMVGHLPLLAVVIVGFVLVATRSARMSPRSVLLARLGLAVLALGSILGIAWAVLLPLLYSRLDYSMTRYGLLFSVFGLVTALLSAAGIGLLVAAVVSRSPAPGFEGGALFPGQHYSPSDQPAGPPPGTG